MFGIGGGEMVFIIIVALMLFGTDKIPEAARTFGKIMSQVKNASNDIKSEIQKSAVANDLDTSLKQITGNYNEEIENIKNNIIKNSELVTKNPNEELKAVEIENPTSEAVIIKEEIKPNVEETDGPIKRTT